MKSCPYCSEEIQDLARKCKHCGEWLDKTHKTAYNLSNILMSAKYLFRELQKKREQKRFEHLYQPTNTKPLKYKNFLFYENYFTEIDNKMEIFYNNITSIEYEGSLSYYNWISSSDIDLRLYIKTNESSNYPYKVRDTFSSNPNMISLSAMRVMFINKKNCEIAEHLYRFISIKSFKNRFKFYFDQIEKHGYFDYPYSLKIYMNGDLTFKDKFQGNMVKAYQSQTIGYGEEWKSLRSSSYSPFILVIHDNGKTTYISVNYDKDVFDAIFYKLILKIPETK